MPATAKPPLIASTLAVLALAAACLAGCASSGSAGGGAGTPGRIQTGPDGDALPTLAIHPLTHIDPPGDPPADEATLALHLTIDDPSARADPRRDRPIHVELLPAEDGPPLRAWTVDLAGESGRARYDALVTRTWLVRLGGVPAAVGAWSGAAAGEAQEADAPWVRVRWEGDSRSVSARLRR